jgi:hypothetical protein
MDRTLSHVAQPRRQADILEQLTPALAVLAAGVAFAHVFIGALLLSSVLRGDVIGDMRAFYSAGVIVRSGDATALFSLTHQTAVQNNLFGQGPTDAFPLPAFAAFVFAPLTLMPYTGAYLGWLAINVALLAALSVAAWKHLSAAPTTLRVAIVASLVFSTPIMMLLFLGQVDLLLLIGVTAAFALARCGREELSGASLALGLFKPHLLIGVIALLVVTRRWRALASFGAVACVMVAVPCIVLGIDSLADQISLIRSSPQSFSPHAMANLRGMIYAVTRTDNAAIWLPVTVAAGVTALIVSVPVWLRNGAASPQSWALAAIVPVVAAPHLHLHSTALVGLALVLFAGRSIALGRIRTGVVLMVYIVGTALCVAALAKLSFVWLALVALLSCVCVRGLQTSPSPMISVAMKIATPNE